MTERPHPGRLGEIVGGKYRIVRMLAAGGMGAVYEAQHAVVKRRFAVKFLHPELAARRDILTRFQREAEAAGALESENVAAAVDFGIAADGTPYIVMEYLVGESLAALLEREGRLPCERAADVVAQACRGIEAAHAAGIVHRDVKPRNLFVCRRHDGTDLVKVLDFGVAKLEDLDENTTSTRTGAVLGTASYMSPEQARGDKQIDHRADIYALGAILYELVSGRRPHPGESHNAVLYHISTQAAVPLETVEPALPSALIETVGRALASDPGARFSSAADLAEALAPIARRKAWPAPKTEVSETSGATSRPPSPAPPEPPRAKGRGRRAALVVAAAALAIVGAAVVLRSQHRPSAVAANAPAPPSRPASAAPPSAVAPPAAAVPVAAEAAARPAPSTAEPAEPMVAGAALRAAAARPAPRPPGRVPPRAAAGPRAAPAAPGSAVPADKPKQAPVTFDQQNPYD